MISFLNGQQFKLTAIGNFQDKYVLKDKDHQQLMVLNPEFNWAKFSYNFSIYYDNKPQDVLLVLLTAYSAYYYIAVQSAAIL